MKQKIKLNAAQVIKHMPEKELKLYKIQLEKEGDEPPSSIPKWFKPYAQKIDFLMEERNKVPKWFKPYAQKIDFLMEERNKVPKWFKPYAQKIDFLMEERNKAPAWFKEFYKEFKDLKNEVKDLKNEIKDFKEYAIKKFDDYDKLFKKHKWIK